MHFTLSSLSTVATTYRQVQLTDTVSSGLPVDCDTVQQLRNIFEETTEGDIPAVDRLVNDMECDSSTDG